MQYYLTIDDAPSPHTPELLAFLKQRNINAIFFCRGDRMEQYPDFMVEAIKDGHILGNHLYSHPRTSTLDLATAKDEILKTENLISNIYERAGVKRPAKLIRFPHMDRGLGKYPFWPFRGQRKERGPFQVIYWEGLNVKDEKPTEVQIRNAALLDEWLRGEAGFESLNLPAVNIGWYRALGIDKKQVQAGFTYSTNDWMARPDQPGWEGHLCRHKYQSPFLKGGGFTIDGVEALCRRFDIDHNLTSRNATGILLAHDQPGLLDVFTRLIGHIQDKKHLFLSPADILVKPQAQPGNIP